MKKELKGIYRYCLGCTRLEDLKFEGTYDCIYCEQPIEFINKILGIEDKKDE